MLRLILTTALTLAPVLSLAQTTAPTECESKKCAVGTLWDAASKTCISVSA